MTASRCPAGWSARHLRQDHEGEEERSQRGARTITPSQEVRQVPHKKLPKEAAARDWLACVSAPEAKETLQASTNIHDKEEEAAEEQ